MPGHSSTSLARRTRRWLVTLAACALSALAPIASAQPAAAADTTAAFVSDSTWLVFAEDPGAHPKRNDALGTARLVCLNDFEPLDCPSEAVRYGHQVGGGGWSADLSPIPGAAWVWAPGISGSSEPAPFASFYFSRTFILTGRPLGGVVYVAADDFAEVIVNGITVGTWGSTTDPSASGHYTLTSFDITSALRPGRNVITIHGQNANFSDCVVHCNYAANPAAVVFGGTLTA